jgi:hypothetical protein
LSARAPALLALCWLASCIQLGWERDSRFEPVADGVLQRLQPGTTELGECLQLFGAPLWVWEQADATGEGAVLAYGWSKARSLGLRFSVPVYENLAASFDYNQIDQRMRGLVLFFDPGWKLTGWRLGLLRDLSRELARPPAAVDDGDAGDDEDAGDVKHS